MALIVEDGTGKSDAESLTSLAFAATYHASLGNTAWAALSDTAKEVALRKGTNYLSSHYSMKWKGVRISQAQALDWPRIGVVDNDGYVVASNIVPDRVQRAVCELALKSLTSELLSDTTEGNIIAESKTVGPISTSTQYAGGGTSKAKQYNFVDDLLRHYIGSSGLKLERA